MQMEFLRSLRQSYHHIPGSKLCPEKGLDVNFWFLSVQMEIKGHSGSCWLLASSSALLSVCLQNQAVINRAAMHLQSDQTLYTTLANIAGQNDFDVPPFRCFLLRGRRTRGWTVCAACACLLRSRKLPGSKQGERICSSTQFQRLQVVGNARSVL